MITADWYFDFVSPFSYLQLADFHQLNSMAHVNLRPVVLGGILQDMGTRGPAEIPPAHPFNPLKALRLAVALKCQPEAVATIFSHIWKDGRSLESAEDWQSLCEQLSVTDADTRIAQPW